MAIPGGRSIQLAHNPAGQLTNASFSSGDTFTARYHATNGLLTNLTYNAGASLAYQYAGGILTNTIWSGAVTGRVGVALNADFRVTTLRVNNTNLATYKYDADGLLTNVGALIITRDPQSGLIAGTTLSNITTSIQRNGFGEVTNYLAAFSGTPLLQFQYAYDRAGRITNKVETIQGVTTQWGYSYDAAGRLHEVRRDGLLASSYTYDNNGNRGSWTTIAGTVTYNHDVQDRLTDYAGAGVTASLQHTDAGEWTNRTANGLTTSYRYDEGGGLREVTLPDATQIQYALDAEGRRVRRVSSSVVTNGWLWLGGLTPVAQLTGSNSVETYFVPGLHANTPEYLIKGTDVFRLLTDHLGSPRLIVNAINGAVVQQMDYDEFGRVTLDTNPGFQPFGFAGGLYDPAMSLVRFGARDYDADTAGWTDKDPIGFAGKQTSLYAYVGSDPINRSDITGTGPRTFHYGQQAEIVAATYGITLGGGITFDTDFNFYAVFTHGSGWAGGAGVAAGPVVGAFDGPATRTFGKGETGGGSIGTPVPLLSAGGEAALDSSGKLYGGTANLAVGMGYPIEAHTFETQTEAVKISPAEAFLGANPLLTPVIVENAFVLHWLGLR